MGQAKVIFIFKSESIRPIETYLDVIPSVGHKVKFDYEGIKMFEQEFTVIDVIFFLSEKQPSIKIVL